jgi:glycosyltransferase involved in cell wall biosynthesis
MEMSADARARPMRIDIVSEHASPLASPGGPDAGGQNVHVRELGGALAAQGHDVTVWTRRDSPRLPHAVEMAPGLRVRHLDAGPSRPIPKDHLVDHIPAMAGALRDAWLTDRPDIVHAHFWMSGLAALAAARDVDVPVVQTFHALGIVKRRHQGKDDSSPEGRIAAERSLSRRADRVIATCSDEVFELARMGASRGSISVVPCGVDTAEFSPAGPALERGSRHRLVTVSRLVRRKGVDETITALATVPDTELWIAGGTDSAGEEPADGDMARLRALAVARGVDDRVRFLGPVPRAELPALLRSADAVVCVPWYEPFGMVPLEAMACGRAVVASAVGGLTDTVVDGVTGVHVPPRRPKALAAALRKLLQSPPLAEAYGIAGRDRALMRYGWDRIAATTADVYRQVAASRAASEPMAQGAR